MSFQKSHLELTLAEVLQIVRAWLRDAEMHNAHVRIGQAFAPLVREQVLFTIAVVEVAIPQNESHVTDSMPEVSIAADDLPNDELTPFDKRDVLEVSDTPISDEEELSF